MSFKLMAWAAEQTTGSGVEKTVLMALADRANADTGLCCPSVARIVEQTEFKQTAVKNALASLVKKGYVTRHRRRRQDGSLGSYHYEFQRNVTTVITGTAESLIDDEPETPNGDLGTGDVSRPGTADVSHNLEGPNQEVNPLAADAATELFDELHVPVWETVTAIYGGPASKSERSDFAKTVIEIKEVLAAQAERDGVPDDVAAWARAEIERRALSVEPEYRSHHTLRNKWTQLGMKSEPVEEEDHGGYQLLPCDTCEGSGRDWRDEKLPCPTCSV